MNGLVRIIWRSLRIKIKIFFFLCQDNNLSNLGCIVLETLMLSMENSFGLDSNILQNCMVSDSSYRRCHPLSTILPRAS